MKEYQENFIFDEIKTYYGENPLFKLGEYYGEIDTDGKVLFLIKANCLCRIDEDLFAIQIGNKWGILNYYTEWLIEPQYDELLPTNDHYYIVKKADKYGIININNDVVTDFVYDSFECISHEKDYYRASIDGKYGIINKFGRIIAPFIYDEISIIMTEYVSAKINGRYGLLDGKGKPIKIDMDSLKQQLQDYKEL